MAESKQSEIESGQAMDNFKLVDGIGPAVEKRLHAAGILTFAQLANLKPGKLARLLDGMVGYSPKRIKEQNWSAQARELAEQAGQSITEEVREPANNSLHYASYTVELLLDRDNQVRRTRLMHVQSRQEATWAGWDVDRLRGFLAESGQLQIAQAQETAPMDEMHATRLAPSKPGYLETSKPTIALQGTTKIIETLLLNQAGQPLGALIPSNTPFEVQLMLDLSQVEIQKGERLSYDATIYMKKLGKSGRDVTGGKEGTLSAGKSAVIDVSNHPLNPGDYHLEAMVALRPYSQPKRLKTQLTALTESMLLHVF